MARGASVYACAAVALLGASGAEAIGVRSPIPVLVRGRVDLRLVADESSTPPWNALSGSPADYSRFMADVGAGTDRIGRLYLKGAASWARADDPLGRVRFRLEQGEYAVAWRDTSGSEVGLCAFGDERRFFTGDLGAPMVDDDVAERFPHRLGLRVDGSHRAVSATYLAARLDEEVTTRLLQLGVARFAHRHVYAALSYRHEDPESGENHALAKAEAAASLGVATTVLSYELSGFGGGVFLPSRSGDGSGAGYRSAAPRNSATFAELRANRASAGASGWITAAARYELVGDEYVDDLSARRPGTATSEVFADWSHRRYAIDARLAYRDVTRFEFLDASQRTLELTARSLMKDNATWLVRGGTELEGDGKREGFAHLGYMRALQRFSGRVDTMVDRIGADALVSAGAEARVNWNATSALTVRWVVRDDVPRSQSTFARLEFRPTRRTWFTIDYGRDAVADGPYFLEDRDLPPVPGADEVVAFTLRGDL